jgi:hypothetical protein
MRKKKKTKPDIRDVKPTIVILEAKLTFNGGSLSTHPTGAIWLDVINAFEKSAAAHGLGCSWLGEVKCSQPRHIDAMIRRLDLNITQPTGRAEASQG